MPLCFSKRSLKKIQKIQKIGEVSGEDSTHTPSRKGQEEKHRYFNVRRSPTPQLLSPARTKVAPLVPDLPALLRFAPVRRWVSSQAGETLAS